MRIEHRANRPSVHGDLSWDLVRLAAGVWGPDHCLPPIRRLAVLARDCLLQPAQRLGEVAAEDLPSAHPQHRRQKPSLEAAAARRTTSSTCVPPAGPSVVAYSQLLPGANVLDAVTVTRT